jgi:hypothetical protein
MTSNQIEEIWISISNYLPERVKLDCAVDYVKTLLDMDIEPSVLKAAGEYDEKLEQAIETVLSDRGLDEEDELFGDE